MYLRKKLIYIIVILFIVFLTGCTNSNGTIENNKAIITGKISIEESIQSIEFSTASSLDKISNNEKNDSTGSYLIKLNKNLKKEFIEKELLTNFEVNFKKISDKIFKLKIKANEEISNKIIEKLKMSDYISHIEKNHRIEAQKTPNDPYFSHQWNLNLLNMTEVWQHLDFNSEVKVAVLDTGISTNHPDLSKNIGYGYDFIDNDNDPSDPDSNFSHGTHVSGIIGALTNNRIGIAGISPEIEIMPVRVIGEAGGNISNLIAGVNWAIENKADIINLSLASSGDSTLLQDALKNAVSKGITVIAAAGNNGENYVSYPARYPEVISVGAIGPTEEKAYYSNYGQALDIVAPGGDSSVIETDYNNILSTAPNERYVYAQGTSMAAPHVSAIAALLYQKGITSPEEIAKILKETATPLDKSGMEKNYYGAGLVNPLKALEVDKSSNYSNNDNNYDDNNDQKEIDLSKVKIFTVRKGEEKNINNSFAKANKDGQYSLESNKGERVLIAWLDKNKDGKINKGDYYKEKSIYIRNDIYEKDLTLLKL